MKITTLSYGLDGLGNLLRAQYTTPDGSGKDIKGDMSDRTVLYDGDGHMAVNGTLEMSRFEGGYFDADGKPHYYLTDYQGNVVRVIDETGLGGQPMDYYPYGEPWQEWDWARADTNSYMIKNRFLYGGKERITQFGLGLYNFEARMYRAPLGRFSTPDKKAIDTPWLSPFAYCACNPVNAIDPTGNVVIFINGMHNGSVGSSEYWGGMDTFLLQEIRDNKVIYYDGACGGFNNTKQGIRCTTTPSAPVVWFDSSETNLSVDYRINEGMKKGYGEASTIMKCLSNDETIKFVSHSMGAAYTKGFIKGMQNYIDKYNSSHPKSTVDLSNIIEFELDLAPFQPQNQRAAKGIRTLVIQHEYDAVAGFGDMPGSQTVVTHQQIPWWKFWFIGTSEHSISSFFDDIKRVFPKMVNAGSNQ